MKNISKISRHVEHLIITSYFRLNVDCSKAAIVFWHTAIQTCLVTSPCPDCLDEVNTAPCLHRYTDMNKSTHDVTPFPLKCKMLRWSQMWGCFGISSVLTSYCDSCPQDKKLRTWLTTIRVTSDLRKAEHIVQSESEPNSKLQIIIHTSFVWSHFSEDKVVYYFSACWLSCLASHQLLCCIVAFDI